MKNIIISLIFIITLSNFTSTTTKNEIKTKVKIFNDNEIQYETK